MSAAAPPLARAGARRDAAAELARWWPLAALTLLAAVLRLSTLGLQSFWYDEAFTVVRDLHPGLGSTLHSVVHTENNPPLWYLIAWADSRVLGTGVVALRLPSALAGIALVPVAWGIGSELAGRRTATLLAALVAVNPLYVWYSQEARPYGLFLFTAGLAILCFLRADRVPTRSRMALFVLSAALALLSHYFAVFLVGGMILWLLRAPGERRRLGLGAAGALVLAGLALLPLVIAQGGHGTQWIGRWSLASRLQAIPQYYLTGYSGAPLGHGVELLVALPLLAGLVIGVRALAGAPAEESAREREGLAAMLLLAGAGILVPLALALFGADYLAPRNLVAAMLPVSAVIAILVGSPPTGRAGALVGALIVLASLAITIDVNFSPAPAAGQLALARPRHRPALEHQGGDHRAAGRDAAAVLHLGSTKPALGYEGAGRTKSTRRATPRCVTTPPVRPLPASCWPPARTTTGSSCCALSPGCPGWSARRRCAATSSPRRTLRSSSPVTPAFPPRMLLMRVPAREPSAGKKI